MSNDPNQIPGQVDFSKPISPADQHNPFAAPNISGADNPSMAAAFVERGLSVTRMGLNLVFYGTIVSMFSLFTAVIGTVAMTSMTDSVSSAAEFLQSIRLIMVSCFGVFFLAAGVALIGQCFAMAVPTVTRARNLVMASIVVQVMSIVAGVLTAVLLTMYQLDNSMDSQWYGWINFASYVFCNGLRVASTILFVLFMRRLAKYLKMPVVSQMSTWLALSVLLMAVVVCAMFTISTSMTMYDSFDTSSDQLLSVMASIMFVVFGAIATVMYCYILFRLIGAIKKSMIRVAIPVT